MHERVKEEFLYTNPRTLPLNMLHGASSLGKADTSVEQLFIARVSILGPASISTTNDTDINYPPYDSHQYTAGSS